MKKELEEFQAKLNNIGAAEFEKEYLGGKPDLRYLDYAKDVWNNYDQNADQSRNAEMLFMHLTAASFRLAERLGFKGDIYDWRQTVKDADKGR